MAEKGRRVSATDLARAFAPQAPISVLFLSFLAYGFVGWLWESTACGLMNRGRFVNSGFLLGPICPIYGVGALACWVLLRGVGNPVALFLMAGALCCGIEYVVGVMLERVTGARFWNYDDIPFNIRGRVCLYGFLLFGAGATVVCMWAQPALDALLGRVPGPALGLAAACAMVALMLDLVFAMASWRRLSTRLEQLRCEIQLRIDEQMGEASDRMIESLPEGTVERVGEAYVRTKEASSEALTKLEQGPAEVAAGLRERAADGAAGMRSRVTRGGAGIRGNLGRIASRVPEPSVWLSGAADALVSQLGRRDLRFFDAFPQLRFKRYDDAIDRAHLRDRIRELFR